VYLTASGAGAIIYLDDKAIIAYIHTVDARWLDLLQSDAERVICLAHEYEWPDTLPQNLTLIDLDARRIAGKADPLSERLLNQLRRYGVRFRYESEGGVYTAW